MSMSEWDGFDPPGNRRQAGSGWEMITNPMMYLPNYMKWTMTKDKFGNVTYHAPAPEPGHHFSGASGAAQSSGGVSAEGSVGGAIPQATVLPETLTPIGTTGSTAGLGLSPTALGLNGATATGSISGAGAPWLKYGKGAVTGLSAYMQAKENQKAAAAAGQGGTATRTPYMANMINPFIPYILQEALNIYSKRQKNIGRTVGDYNPLQAILGQFFQNYTSQK